MLKLIFNKTQSVQFIAHLLLKNAFYYLNKVKVQIIASIKSYKINKLVLFSLKEEHTFIIEKRAKF